jgi:DNA-binding Lrp family transcriptional regulator
MGYRGMTWVRHDTDLAGSEYLVAYMIASLVDDEDGTVKRKNATLADDCHMSERQVRNIISQLEAKGILAIGKRFNPDGRQLCNVLILKGFAASIGLTVDMAMDKMSAREVAHKLPKQRSYDFSKNGKPKRKNKVKAGVEAGVDDLPLFANADSSPALSEGGTDDAGEGFSEGVGGNSVATPQVAVPLPPYLFTLSLSSFSSNTPIGTDVPIVQQAEAPEEEKEEELPFTDKPEPKPRTSKGRKKVAVSDEEMALRSRTSKLLQLYVEWLGYEPTSYGREGVAAKALAKSGWTDEQIEACYRSLKAERFWSDKHLSLGVVRTNIAARVGTVGTNSKGAVNGNLNTNGRFQFARDAGSANASDEGSGNTDADADAEWAAFLAERAR